MKGKKEMIPKLEIKFDLNGTKEEEDAFKKAISQENFINAKSFRDQIGLLCQFLRNDELHISYQRIGYVFGETSHCAMMQHKKFLKGSLCDGRPPCLNDDEIENVKNFVKKLHTESKVFPTYNDVQEYIFSRFRKSLLPDTVRHLFRIKLQDEFHTVPGEPMEQKRIDAKLANIEQNLNLLSQEIIGIPSGFIFNLDEVGYEEFADAHEITVIVPANYQKATAPYPVNRRKRTSALVCISMNGLECNPQFTVQRTTVDDELYRYVPIEKIQIVNTKNGFITTKSFLLWLQKVFLPFLHNKRLQTGYQGQCIIIMDGYLPHAAAFNQIDLAGEKIIIHYLIPHTSHMLQPLDLVIFSSMKSVQVHFEWESKLTQQSKQIAKLYHSLHKAAGPVNCRSAFRAAGIATRIDQSLKEVIYIDLTLMNNVPYYEISYIQGLIEQNMQITQNQYYIYNENLKKTPPPKGFRMNLEKC